MSTPTERKRASDVSALSDDAQVVKMHDYACSRLKFKRDHESLARVFAFAEHSIRHGDAPLALFWSLVRNGATHPIAQVDWDAGWARAKRIEEARTISKHNRNVAV
ncbi:MAG: hypothetical protein OXG25_02365 [Gammaproteobacteria bacterium]|nr:hypothetical protein [Gammaproteobacteria bacterium]